MNDLETMKKPYSLWGRLLWVVCVPTFVLSLLSLSLFAARELRAAGDLAEVLRSLDETDPGWRLDDIEAARIRPLDKENSAVLCRDLARMLGPDWPDAKLVEHFRHVPIGELLDVQQTVILEDEMTRLESVRRDARKMVALPKGRHKLEFQLNPLVTLLTDQQGGRKVAGLFDYEMRYRANKGEVSEAVRAGRACVCLGRSLYDEPTLISVILRNTFIVIGTDGVERSLALGESNEAELVALDALLEDEGRQNTYLVGLRGERAVMYLLYKRLAAGELPADLLLSRGERSGLQGLLRNEKKYFSRQIPGLLRTYSRAVENARLPMHEQADAERALAEDTIQKGETDPGMLASSYLVADKCRRVAAQIATMRGLIAVERFRMKHGKWPAAMADVVPAFLKAVPTDPYDGKPIKTARVADGVIVYSVGPDGVDDGGKLDRKRPPSSEGDIGYQLWDVAKRRRPASTPRPEENP